MPYEKMPASYVWRERVGGLSKSEIDQRYRALVLWTLKLPLLVGFP